MFKNITKAQLEKYLESLKEKNLSTDLLEKKKNSLIFFLDWAVKKGYMTKKDFNQLNESIAKFNFGSDNISKGNTAIKNDEIIIEPQTTNVINSPTKISIKYAYSYIKSTLLNSPLNLIIVTIVALSLFSIPFFFSSNQKKYSQIVSSPIFNKSKILSFKANLTDSKGNPITDKTDVTFSIYTQPSGGAPIYTGGCTGENALTPTLKGEIQAKLGKDCGMTALPESLFTANSQLYLGITAGSDPEMQPRKQLANVGFATTASNIQGFQTGNSASSIPVINQEGDLIIDSENAGIKSISKSTNFTVGSAFDLTLEASGEGNIVLQTKDAGDISFKTHVNGADRERLLIANNGNIGINGADTSLFGVQVAGDIGPNFTNVYDLGSPTHQWNVIYGNTIYQNGHQVCDTSNNCSGVVASGTWSSLTSPEKDLDLSMGNNTTKFTFGNNTSNSDLFTLKDSAYNTGTGYLFNIESAAGSTIKPFHVSGSGSDALSVTYDGRVGIGINDPTAKLQVKYNTRTSVNNYAAYIENTSTNSTDDGVSKYGLYISSTGDFKGRTNSNTNNYGIYINTTTGAPTGRNYDIYAASGAYLSTGGDWINASSRDLKENFEAVDSTDILNKINQLDLTTWNYKNEQDSIRHLGPMAQDFYSIFQLGNSDKNISTIDPAGVALAGIQALDRKITNVQNNSNFGAVNSEGDVEITQTTNNTYTYSGDIEPTPNSFDIASTNGTIINSVKAFGEIITSKIKTGIIDTQEAVVHQTLFAKNIISKNLTVSEKITSPIVETNILVASEEARTPLVKTNQIEALSDNVTINLNTSAPTTEPQNTQQNLGDKGALAELIIKGVNDKAVTTIDAQGNITTDGSLTSNSVETNQLHTQSLSANTASISGELVADNIRSKALDDIHNQVNSTNNSLSDITNQVNDVQKTIADIKNQSALPSSYSPLSEEEKQSGNSLLADNTKTDGNFDNVTVSNMLNVYKGTISDSLSIGSLLIKDNSISSISPDLYLSSLGSIKFFDNSVVIAKDGSITTQGTLTALGGVKTDKIQPANTQNVSVLLENGNGDQKMEFVNSQNETVASIDKNGVGKFKELSLNKYTSASSSAIIAAADNFTKNGVYSPAI
jgi:hypothetical protein